MVIPQSLGNLKDGVFYFRVNKITFVFDAFTPGPSSVVQKLTVFNVFTHLYCIYTFCPGYYTSYAKAIVVTL